MHTNRWSTERRSGPLNVRQGKGAVNQADDSFVLEEEDQIPGAYAISTTSFAAPRSSLFSLSSNEEPDSPPQIQESPVFEDEPMEDMGRAWATAHVWQSVAFRSVREINQGARPRDVTTFDLQRTIAMQKKRYGHCSKSLLVTLLGVCCCGIAAALAGILLSRKGERTYAAGRSGRLIDMSCETNGALHDYHADCECLVALVEDQIATKHKYEFFKQSDTFRSHLSSDVSDKCDPSNMALMWTAVKASSIHASETALSHFVLALVYETMGGQEWANDSGWLTRSSVCSWYGVTCASNLDEGSIESLSLPSNGVKGALDSRLALLPKLQTLDFSNNMVTGTIPSEIWRVTGLVNLLLENNEIVGTLPSPFSDFESASSLQQIALGSNDIFGSIPDLSGLISLTLLDLSDTLIDSAFPTEGLADLGNLEVLKFDRVDNLRGTLPSSLGLLTSLRSLNMTNTQLSGSIPGSFSNLVALESFEVFSSQLTGSIPSTLDSLDNLRTFQVTSSYLSGSIPTSFGNLTNLAFFSLKGNMLEGTIPRELAGCASLLHLDVSENKDIRGSIPEEMGALSSLQEFVIDHTLITGSLPGGFCDQSIYVYHLGVPLDSSCCELQRCTVVLENYDTKAGCYGGVVC